MPQKLKLENLEDKLFVVAGGGCFGAKAVMFAKDVHAKVVVVDDRFDCEASNFVEKIVRGGGIAKALSVKPGYATLFVQDAVEFLVRLVGTKAPDYIVPAIPGNLAAKVVKRWLEHKGLVVEVKSQALKDVLKDIPENLILLCDENVGVIITSYMPKGSLCRVPCNQPVNFCPTTGRGKIGPMHRVLANVVHDKVTLGKILVSHIFRQEFGSFQGSELTSFLSDVEKLNVPCSLAVGTACSCHGILNLFSVRAF